VRPSKNAISETDGRPEPETLAAAYRGAFLTSCRRGNAELIKVEELLDAAG